MAAHSLMTTRTRRTRAALVALALTATACGGGTVDTSDAGSSTEDQATTTTPTAAVVSTSEDVSSDESLEDVAGDTDAVPVESRDLTTVLAFAIDASDQESFTFTQGLSINIGPAGVPAPDSAPYAFGEVVDGQTHVLVDLETFVAESMGSLAGFGLGPGELVGQKFEVWSDDSTLTMDLTDIDIVGETAQPLTEGPVSVTVSDATSVDMNAVARQFGQGSQITNPNAMFDALQTLSEGQEVGPAMLGDIPVTVYASTLTVADYYAAIGASASDQLSTIESLGLAESEAEAISGLIPLLETLDMNAEISVDDDGRVRRVSTTLDVTDVVVALFESSVELSGTEGPPQVDIGALFGPDGLGVVLSNWQEFHDYGAAPAIVVPEAEDVTDMVDDIFSK